MGCEGWLVTESPGEQSQGTPLPESETEFRDQGGKDGEALLPEEEYETDSENEDEGQ